LQGIRADSYQSYEKARSLPREDEIRVALVGVVHRAQCRLERIARNRHNLTR
jgi:hypothetical protein